MATVKPITPDEIPGIKKQLMPDYVIEAFNELLAKNCRNGYATIMQKDAVALIMQKGNLEDSNILFKNNWLDIEEIYRESGWKVTYDKPGYNESYEPSWEFKQKK